MLAIYEDLRDRTAPAGAPDHLVAPRRRLDDIDLRVVDALAFQQRACPRAIRAEHRGIKLDFNHSSGGSDLGMRRCALPSIRATAPYCQASGRHRAVIISRSPARAPASKPRPTRRPPALAHERTPRLSPRSFITSSITTSRFPATLRPALIAKAPRTLRARAVGPRRPCTGVRRCRTSQSAATSGTPAERIGRAGIAAWL